MISSQLGIEAREFFFAFGFASFAGAASLCESSLTPGSLSSESWFSSSKTPTFSVGS